MGQEIPDSWFEVRRTGKSSKSGFGISIEQSPIIESYLQNALNTEFNKLSPTERQQHDYASINKTIKNEAKRTKQMPDIAAIIKANRNTSQARTNEQENEMKK